MSTVCFHFQLVKQNDSYVVWLMIDGDKQGEFKFDCDLNDSSELVQAIERIEYNDCDSDDLKYVGSLLWDGLVSDEVLTILYRTMDESDEHAQYHFRIELPDAELERLPWEALYETTRIGFLSDHARFCILRHPPALINPLKIAKRSPGPLSVLVVIPTGSGLGVEYEWNNIRGSVARFDEAKIHLERLDGDITPDKLYDALRRQSWDVVHFVGHGERDDDKVKIRLNGDQKAGSEYWMEAETFAGLFSENTVRLAVLNCCEGAAHTSASGDRTLSGLGPYLLKKGVPAVIAMRYEINDQVAIKFSGAFYQELLDGEEPGRVDCAIERARKRVYQNRKESTVRGFITPNFFVFEGHERLFEVQEAPPPQVKPVPIIHEPDVDRLLSTPEFQDLVAAVRERRCIPVIGSGIFCSAATRSSTASASLQQLAVQLAEESGYPVAEDFELRNRAGQWMDTMLLQWVCQYYETANRRFKLILAIQEFYKSVSPPRIIDFIASIKVPGIIYIPFDGLMEQAFSNRDIDVRVVNLFANELETRSDEQLLVTVTGTLNDHKSLILTEEDHDRLWNRLGKLNHQITDMVCGHLGRTLLFLGVPPRDGIPRRLALNMLAANSGGERPIFVCPNHTEVDRSYWNKYQAQWISAEVDELVDALTVALNGEPPV